MLLASCSHTEIGSLPNDVTDSGSTAGSDTQQAGDSSAESSFDETADSAQPDTSANAETQDPTVSAGTVNEDMFTNRDKNTDYDDSDAITVRLDGDTAAASDKSVIIDGGSVTITKDATHIISGNLTNGTVTVNAPESAKLQLVFNGVSIKSSTGAALLIVEADKVFVTLADGTENRLENGGEFAENEFNVDGAVFSKQDLTFNGSGSLTVTSPAGHGIVCKDDLVFTGGNYSVTSASHGIEANDSVRAVGSCFAIEAGKDGVHAENNDDEALGFFYSANASFDITAEGDGISAAASLTVDGGSYALTCGGGSENGTKVSSDGWGGFPGGMGRPGDMGRPGGMGSPGDMGSPGGMGDFGQTDTTDESEDSTSMKGIKCAGDITVNAGTFTVNSADDSIHSNACVTVNGGTFKISSGDDGFHADDTLTISDCDAAILESYEGLEAEHIYVNGGSVTLKASDDGLNAAGGTDSSGEGGRDGMFGGMGGGMSGSSTGTIEISGGVLYVNASGDGIDANGSIVISGGHTTVVGPTQGDTATLDFDTSAEINGGVFIGTGAQGMAQTFSSSSQGLISVSVGSNSAGQLITVTDSNGNELLSYAPELSYQILIFSSPKLITGDSYTVNVGSASGTVTAD